MRLSSKRAVLVIIIGIVTLLVYGFIIGPTAQIRLDTGDLRYLCLGIPFDYRPMSEPQRSQLIALSQGSDVLKPVWHSCATHVGSNNADAMCRGFYFRATAWVAVDRRLAQMIVEDIASYVHETDARHGLPDSVGMLSFVIGQNDDGSWSVKPGWKNNDLVLEYLQLKRYSPPATQETGR